ncbi:uncharacterized protein LOC143072585 [Mytilus galloprovincialis]|uniref:uncharacterized protein LOC143072585 n=1 Tax=Mytilus galloprovincialis TaxID=29158 RepID=UPI003F7BE588
MSTEVKHCVKSSMPDIFKEIKDWNDDMRSWPNLMYGDIYNYLIRSKAVDGETMKNFKSLQSYNYFQSGNVDKILHFNATDNKIFMKASVRSSQTVSRLNDAYVMCTGEGAVEQAWCTCMAGLGLSCSHVGALLWKIEYAVRNSMTGVSCTDETAKWNRGTTRNIEPKPLVSIQLKKPKLGENTMGNENVPGLRDTPFYVSKEEFKEAVNASPMLPLFEIKGTIMNKSFKSNPSVRTQESIEQVHGEHNDLSSCAKCVQFLSKYVFLTDSQVVRLQTETTLQSKSLLWKDCRKLRITASSAHKVPVKETTDSTNFIREHLHPKFVGNKFTKHGQQGEIDAKVYLNSNGHQVQEKGICVSQQENWLSASPDGIFDGQTLLEIKCPVPSSSWSTLDQLFESGKYDVGKDENGDLVVKEKGSRGIYLQVQLTMYCTGLKQCKLLVWLGVDEHKYIDILYNETYVNNQVTRLKTFYVKKLLPCLVNEIQDDRLMMSKAFVKFMHI